MKIRATVNKALLRKASRMFTGSSSGIAIELLQNAVRSGATELCITVNGNEITFHDNGLGIQDFSRLLEMGGDRWPQQVIDSNDPAGVGLFCLAPREVTITSSRKSATISGEQWCGEPIDVADVKPIIGTRIVFHDDVTADSFWCKHCISGISKYSGLKVIFKKVGQNGVADTIDVIEPEQFVDKSKATIVEELGCAIEILGSRGSIAQWSQVSLNFHGQVISFRDIATLDACADGLMARVDMLDMPTPIRLMLPARTRIVENDGYRLLIAALEKLFFQYWLKNGCHQLKFSAYQRAHELGIDLPESAPVFAPIGGTEWDPVNLVPLRSYDTKNINLAKCVLVTDMSCTDEINVALALHYGTPPVDVVPIRISDRYDGYGWVKKIPRVTSIEVTPGKSTLLENCVWFGSLTCLDSISASIEISDGRKWSFQVPVAAEKSSESDWHEGAWVTPDAEQAVRTETLLCLLGGVSDEGDTYDTQIGNFEQELSEFFAKLCGDGECLRRDLLEVLEKYNHRKVVGEWSTARITKHGVLVLKYRNGVCKTIRPPASKKKRKKSGKAT